MDVHAIRRMDPAPASAPRPAAAPAAGPHSPDVTIDALPASPPPAVLRDVDAAGRRADELRAQGRELHFDVDIRSGKVRVEVRDLDGHTLRVLPLNEALGVADGAPVGV
jgi:hypothetical protein